MTLREKEPFRIWAAFVFFWSSYAPLSVILAARDFKKEPPFVEHPEVVFPALVLSFIGLIILKVVMTSFKGQHMITVNTVELRSNDLVTYVIPYLAALLPIELSKGPDVSAFVLFMALLFCLSLKTNCLFINPILALWGYGLYQVEFEENNIKKSCAFISNVELTLGSCYRMDRVTRFLCVVSHKES